MELEEPAPSNAQGTNRINTMKTAIIISVSSVLIVTAIIITFYVFFSKTPETHFYTPESLPVPSNPESSPDETETTSPQDQPTETSEPTNPQDSSAELVISNPQDLSTAPPEITNSQESLAEVETTNPQELSTELEITNPQDSSTEPSEPIFLIEIHFQF
jgi:cell division protein FtsN